MDFIAQEQAAYPELSERYQKLKDLHARKLYHELTGELTAFVKDPSMHKPGTMNLAKLYTNFIKSFQDKLNQVKLVCICIDISSQYTDTNEALTFMESVSSTINDKKAHEASLLCRMHMAKLQLSRGETFYPQVKDILENYQVEIESLVGAEAVVHAAYYRVACNYYSSVGPAHKFYKHALMYLAYVKYEDLTSQERFDLAVNLSIAALTGKGVFNFGEVLATPILQVLKGTDKEWLSNLLHVFNKGDVDGFNEIVAKHHAAMTTQPALSAALEYLKEKVALLALMDLVFQRPSQERNLTFGEIAAVTRLSLSQVEWLVMRALSCQLIKGTIDQVEEIVRVSWVQPRVLDKDQIQELVTRFDGWEKKVHETLLYVEDQTPELFQ